MLLPSQPLSNVYGFDRGTPVDRHYIHQFLSIHAVHIAGHVAEIKDATYAHRYGADRLTNITVIDIDAANPHATLITDLVQPHALPTDAYDCILLTQTLQLLPDPLTTLTTCHHALRPGGHLLLTVPALGRLSISNPHYDYWRFTPAGLRHLLHQWPGPAIVTGYGNLRTCLAALLGEVTTDLTDHELNRYDPSFSSSPPQSPSDPPSGRQRPASPGKSRKMS
jgi:SAM-dependent methyltransferase